MKYRQRMKLHLRRKKVVSQQIEQFRLNKAEAHSSVPSIRAATAATIRQNPPPLLKLLDPQDRGIFTPRPLMTATLQDYHGATNITLEIPSEGMQAAELTCIVLQQQRHPHEALPVHRYHMLQVFTPHCVHTVAPDEIVMPQPPLRAVTTHTDSTYLLTVDASHYKMEEDEKLEYCRELLPCSKELQEARYSEVLKGQRIALQARVTAREDMLRFIECVKRGELQVEGCSVDEAVEELVHHGFSSDPEEMMYRCGDLDEFWKERYEDGHVGWHQQGCLPHQVTTEASKLVREQGMQYIAPSDMGPYGRHWYPDYSYLRQAVIAAKTRSQLVEQLTEELNSYRHHLHHLDSITPMELFTDDREALLERLYEEAQVEQLKEQQQAVFQSQLEAKQYHVSSNHLAGVTILRQLPTNFNDFRFCLDIFAYVLSIHAYDLALKIAIKEFCDMRGYYLFRSFLLKMIRKNRREILEVLENSKRMSFSFSDQISAANPVNSGDHFDVSPRWSDDGVGSIPSKQPEAPATSGHPPDTALHHKDKKCGNKGKRSLSQHGKKTSQQHVRSNVHHHRTDTVPRHHRTGSVPRHHRTGTVPRHHRTGTVPRHHRTGTVPRNYRTGTVPRHHRTGTRSGHHRTATTSRHHRTVTSSRHERTSTISRHHTTVTSSKHRRTVISSRHRRIIISSRYHRTVTSSRYCKTVTSSRHYRTGTTPRHHKSSSTTRHNRTDTTSRHQRTSTSSTHHSTHNVSRHHRTHTTSRKHRSPGTTSSHNRTHTTASHKRNHTSSSHNTIHTTARHQRTHTTARKHRPPGTTRHHKTHTASRHHTPHDTTTRHHKTHNTSRHHRPTGSTSRHHRTSTSPGHHRTSTPLGHRTSTPPGHHTTSAIPVPEHHMTNAVPDHHTTGTVAAIHYDGSNSAFSDYRESEGGSVGYKSKGHRIIDGQSDIPFDRAIDGESLDKTGPSGESENGDTAIIGEKGGDRFFVRRNDSDMVLERDYEGYKTVHSGGSSGHKRHVVSQQCGNGSNSFLSNIHDDEIKQIFEGSSEDETATPSSGERISHNKDPGSHAVETNESEGYSITSNDKSDSGQDAVHNGGDDSDVNSTSCDSNKKKKALVSTTRGRVPHSFNEFGDSSSDIISYDTSSDEGRASGISDEKEPHSALSDGSDSDAMTLAGYMKQGSDNAEIADHKKKAHTAEKKKRDNRKMHEKEESLWEPVALTESEGHLTSWGPLKLIYDNLSTLLQKWDHHSYLVRVFHRAFKLECEKWREVVKRTYRLLSPKFREMERRREAKKKAGWYKLSTPLVNTRVKYQGRKSPCGAELRWVQNHVHWLMKYDMTLNLKHHALVRLLLKKRAGQAK
ncbi:filaggrin-like isoform X1 [Scylla paramamosain]